MIVRAMGRRDSFIPLTIIPLTAPGFATRRDVLKDVPGETPGTAGEDARAPPLTKLQMAKAPSPSLFLRALRGAILRF
jgi:hypothetical protein